MTAREKQAGERPEDGRPAPLPFDPAELVALRVLPAQFARMCEVSKQTVSQWIKRGIVTLGPDGKLDPAVAGRQVIERTNPIRLRARVFRHATAGLDESRARVRELEQELASEREWGDARSRAAGFCARDEAAQAVGRVVDALCARFDEACAAHAAGGLEPWLDELVAVEFFGEDLAEYRAAMADDEAGPAG